MGAARLEHKVQLQLTTSLMSASNSNLTVLQWHAPMYFMVVPIRMYVVINKLDFNSANFEIHMSFNWGIDAYCWRLLNCAIAGALGVFLLHKGPKNENAPKRTLTGRCPVGSLEQRLCTHSN